MSSARRARRRHASSAPTIISGPGGPMRPAVALRAAVLLAVLTVTVAPDAARFSGQAAESALRPHRRSRAAEDEGAEGPGRRDRHPGRRRGSHPRLRGDECQSPATRDRRHPVPDRIHKQDVHRHGDHAPGRTAEAAPGRPDPYPHPDLPGEGRRCFGAGHGSRHAHPHGRVGRGTCSTIPRAATMRSRGWSTGWPRARADGEGRRDVGATTTRASLPPAASSKSSPGSRSSARFDSSS